VKHSPNKSPLYKISIRITPQAEDAVVEWLTNFFGQPAVAYTDLERHTTCAVSYVERFGAQQRSVLRDGLRRLRDAGVDVDSDRVSVRRVPFENWAKSWKRHFKPLAISARLLVLPSWSKRKPRRGQAVVILDPGLSFGTGHHPTTAFCLEHIASCRDTGARQSLLDIGTGSGILSIAAAKLGYARVVAFDFDPDAVRVAKENSAVNRVRIDLSRGDLRKLPVRAGDRFTVVCANLTSDVLIEQRRKIAARVANGGTLLLAGILKKEFLKVQRAYEASGFRLVTSRVAKEWRSGTFRFRR
jgi:ribosomal protein L11 methyltransferase